MSPSERGLKRKRKAEKVRKLPHAQHLSVIQIHLLELFATVDDVFSEEGAFSPEKKNTSLGRIYREWKRVRSRIDPEFDPKKYRQEQ